MVSRIFALFLMVLAFSVQAEDQSNDSALTQLVERLTKIDSISGAFVQYTVDQKGVRLQESKGEFKAERPGKFYWYTSEPLEQSIYTDGETVTIYDPDLEQATIQKLSTEISATPAVLFSGSVDDIGQQFDVQVSEWEDSISQFLLTPKKNDSLFERMVLRFEGKHITEMRLSDSLGQENAVSFIHTQMNPSFTQADFAPDFPEGTDIIRDIPEHVIN